MLELWARGRDDAARSEPHPSRQPLAVPWVRGMERHWAEHVLAVRLHGAR